MYKELIRCIGAISAVDRDWGILRTEIEHLSSELIAAQHAISSRVEQRYSLDRKIIEIREGEYVSVFFDTSEDVGRIDFSPVGIAYDMLDFADSYYPKDHELGLLIDKYQEIEEEKRIVTLDLKDVEKRYRAELDNMAYEWKACGEPRYLQIEEFVLVEFYEADGLLKVRKVEDSNA